MEKYFFEKIEIFFNQGKHILYRKGEIIIRPDDEPQGLYFVKSGFVKMNSIFEDGKQLTLNIFKANSYFPMMWAIADIPNEYSYEAFTDVELFRMEKEKVIKFLEKNPDVLYEFTRRILVGLDGLIKNIEQLFKGNAYQRVVAAIYLTGKRFGKIENGRILIDLPLTHQDIADMSALSRETTSIEMNKLRLEKLISYKTRKITIEKIKELEETYGSIGFFNKTELI